MNPRNHRKTTWLAVSAIVLWALLWIVPMWAQTTDVSKTSPPISIEAVNAIGMTVADMDRSVHFFKEILEFTVVCDVTQDAPVGQGHLGRIREVALSLGSESLILRQYLDHPGAAFPADSRANDHWFQHIAIVVSDLDRAYAKLRAHRVRHASSGPQTLPDWNQNAGGISAFYFRDPDGHFLELIHFPADKGDPKWQRPTDRMFLGIDHTAIVVADTQRSVEFYRDQLGLRIVGTSENYGDEQERLNGVFAARLKITALRAEHGPGVELLEYLSPTDGRAMERPIQPNDIAHWQIETRGTPRDGIAGEPVESIGDPDGHVIQIRY